MINSLKFREQLSGDVVPDTRTENVDCEKGWLMPCRIELDMTIHIDDLATFVRGSKPQASVKGSAYSDGLAGRTAKLAGIFKSSRNRFRTGQNAEYFLDCLCQDRTLHLHGTRVLPAERALLDGAACYGVFVEVTDGDKGRIAFGMLRSNIMDVFDFVQGMNETPTKGISKLEARFLELFLGKRLYSIVTRWPGSELPCRRRKLSLPHDQVKSQYDVVVVGSGYGGSIIAARLSAWGQESRKKTVCVLERGSEWMSGDFPTSPKELFAVLRSDSNPKGLFEYTVHEQIDVLNGNGLGGTSLINAGVMSMPDQQVMQDPRWPVKLPDLAPYFDRALRSLHSKPHSKPPAKSRVFRQAAGATADLSDVHMVDLAITFERTERTEEGVLQAACIDCGECVTGCNYTAKNSLDMNYLPIAQSHGAEIFCCVEVRAIEKLDTGTFRLHCVDLEDPSAPRALTIGAVQVVLAAGVLGTFSILSRSRQEHRLRVPSGLGRSFSGNGNILGIVFGSRPQTKPHKGPTVTTVAKYWNAAELSEKFIVEEGGIPGALTGLIRATMPLLRALWPESKRKWTYQLKDLARVLADHIGLESFGPLNCALLLLGSGFDDGNGRLIFERDRTRVQWRGINRQPHVMHLQNKMKELSSVLQGTFLDDPRALEVLGGNMHTVHPLGGCVMGDNEQHSVVSHKGEVHGHEGLLYIADASVIPTPLGVNPALTIAALSEWFAAQIIASWSREHSLRSQKETPVFPIRNE